MVMNGIAFYKLQRILKSSNYHYYNSRYISWIYGSVWCFLFLYSHLCSVSIWLPLPFETDDAPPGSSGTEAPGKTTGISPAIICCLFQLLKQGMKSWHSQHNASERRKRIRWKRAINLETVFSNGFNLTFEWRREYYWGMNKQKHGWQFKGK